MYPEVALKLHVNPVVHGIAESVGHSFGESLELLAWTGVSGNALLADAVRAQEPPLVMVMAKPQIGDIVPTLIICDLFWRKVVVIINDGLMRSDLMVKPSRGV